MESQNSTSELTIEEFSSLHEMFDSNKMMTVLSDHGRIVFEIINFVFVCSIVGIFGITSNVLNIAIFYNQGFNNSANIGFFALAISDMSCLVALQWASVCMNPLFGASGVPWHPLEVMYLSGAWPHVCFSRITSFITVYITAERYLSIALPLKVKHIVTPKVTTVLICLIYAINLMTLIPEYATSYLGWRYVLRFNKTLIALVFTSSRNCVEGMVYVLHSLLGISSFGGVIVFTSLLIGKLGQSSEWRKEVTSEQRRRESMSNREQKMVKMILLIACALILCYTPGAVISMATFIVGPEFNIRGIHINICEATWSVAFSFQAINSSINIFFYYTMSSKYRQTFNEIILRNVYFFKKYFTRKRLVTVTSDSSDLRP